MEFIKNIPQRHDIRIVTKFLLLPKTLRTMQIEVTKWLEKATWEEQYRNTQVKEGWYITKFLD